MNRSDLEPWLVELGSAQVCERLAPYVTPERRAKIENVVGSRLGSIAMAIEAPSDPHNAAAVVRTSEALGALEVHVVQAEGGALHARSVTQGSFHWVATHHHPDLSAFRQSLGARRLFGACVRGHLVLEELPVDAPLCLLFGNEQRGLSPSAREMVDGLFRIPLVGMSESLNLSVSAAIALFETSRRRRSHLAGNAGGVGASGTNARADGLGDLSTEQRERERAFGYAVSLEPRLVRGLLAAARRGDAPGNAAAGRPGRASGAKGIAFEADPPGEPKA